jgi:hypothetical protein
MSERPQVLVELGQELDRVAPRAIRSPRRRAASGLLIALALGVTVAVAAVALIIPRHPPSRSPTTAGTAGSRLPRSFAAFRRARTGADLLTGSAFDAIADLPGFAIEPGLSRLVLAKPGELIWLVPGPVQPASAPAGPVGRPRVASGVPSDTGGRAVLCMVIQIQVESRTDIQGVCAPAALAAGNGLSLNTSPTTAVAPRTSNNPDGFVAVLPDGSRAIEAVRVAGASVGVIPNADGVIQTGFQPRYLSFRGADGKRHTLSPLQSQPGLTFEGSSTPPIGNLAGQLTLEPSARAGGPSGVARIYKSPHLDLISFDLFRLPLLSSPGVYAAWLDSPPDKSKLLAIIHSGQTREGELTTYCALPSHPARFRELLITTERTLSPREPGRPVLTSTFALP